MNSCRFDLQAPRSVPVSLAPEPPENCKPYANAKALSLRVRVPNSWVPGLGLIVFIMQVLGKYMVIRYLDP